MTMDAIIMMAITLVGYVGGFAYFLSRVFKKEKMKNK
ncbi:MAG: MetS family NSS transporter small subunit [Lachnospiraceae bacterium]|nr:MetS family NSS transporter small subunit [Lachnospiraceae bacterium]